MNTIVVYYSLEGNTDFAAKRIAARLGASTLRLHPKKEYPSGRFTKFLWGGKSAVMSETPQLEPYEFNAADYDRVILGFPVWASTVTPPIRSFVNEHDLSAKRVAAFACMSGSGAEKAFGKLKECLGIETFEAEAALIDPKASPSEDNDRKIEGFCNKLLGV